MDDDSETDTELALALAIAGAAQATQSHTLMRTTPLSGKAYIEELITSANPQRCFEVLRMSLETFFALRDWLLLHSCLRGSRKYKGVSVEEKLIIFLYTTSKGASSRDCCERFSHSPSTISKSVIISLVLNYKLIVYRAFHEVLQALVVLHQHIVQQPLPPPDTIISRRILDDTRFTPYFNSCIGALDGTHIACHVPTADQPRYRNRKQYLSQNVLAICNFDLQFVYVLPGWEGSAHDQRVLQSALYQHGLNIPKGQYYLGDAGYSNTPYCLVPYRGVRYHLKEQRQANLKYI
jgi:hypothetical protein